MMRKQLWLKDGEKYRCPICLTDVVGLKCDAGCVRMACGQTLFCTKHRDGCKEVGAENSCCKLDSLMAATSYLEAMQQHFGESKDNVPVMVQLAKEVRGLGESRIMNGGFMALWHVLNNAPDEVVVALLDAACKGLAAEAEPVLARAKAAQIPGRAMATFHETDRL